MLQTTMPHQIPLQHKLQDTEHVLTDCSSIFPGTWVANR